MMKKMITIFAVYEWDIFTKYVLMLVNAKKIITSYNYERGYTTNFHCLVGTVRENSWSSTREHM